MAQIKTNKLNLLEILQHISKHRSLPSNYDEDVLGHHVSFILQNAYAMMLPNEEYCLTLNGLMVMKSSLLQNVTISNILNPEEQYFTAEDLLELEGIA